MAELTILTGFFNTSYVKAIIFNTSHILNI